MTLKPKTYKRELACAMLAALIVGWVWALLAARPDAYSELRFLTPFVFIFLGGAYGVDAYAKQIRG